MTEVIVEQHKFQDNQKVVLYKLLFCRHRQECEWKRQTAQNSQHTQRKHHYQYCLFPDLCNQQVIYPERQKAKA